VYKNPQAFFQRRDFTVEVLDTRTYRPSFDEPFTLEHVLIRENDFVIITRKEIQEKKKDFKIFIIYFIFFEMLL
jgi:hypothetical protein